MSDTIVEKFRDLGMTDTMRLLWRNGWYDCSEEDEPACEFCGEPLPYGVTVLICDECLEDAARCNEEMEEEDLERAEL
jgi:hypothetical protein